MADAVQMSEVLTGIQGAPVADSGSSVTTRLRTAGYCEECGTWDAHGPICLSCGYDFSGAGDEPGKL